MSKRFNLFVYGTLRRGGSAESMMRDSDWVGIGQVGGVLYDIDGKHPALVVYGSTPVEGDVWRCPVELLPSLDAYEGVDESLFKRIGVTVRLSDTKTDIGCWTYVAGPALARRLTPTRRIKCWPPSLRV